MNFSRNILHESLDEDIAMLNECINTPIDRICLDEVTFGSYGLCVVSGIIDILRYVRVCIITDDHKNYYVCDDDSDYGDDDNYYEVYRLRRIVNVLKDAFKRWDGVTNIQEIVVCGSSKKSKNSLKQLDIFLKQNFPQLGVLVTYKSKY